MSDLKELAAAAYIYGYPMLEDLHKVADYTSNPQTPGAAPVNTFGHYKSLAGPESKFVSINNDTIYSILQADLSAEPLVLHVPDTAGRYYVLQFIDAWTNNFAYVGKRATGTNEANYFVVAPNWRGQAPAGMLVIHAPTSVFSILGRIAINGAAEMPIIQALQAHLTATPLSNYLSGTPAPQHQFGDWSLPQPDNRVPDSLRFWEKLRVWMQAFPPSASDHAFQQQFASLGLLDSTSPYLNTDPALAQVLAEGEAEAKQILKATLQSIGGANRAGWNIDAHIFDYNVDFFEIGTINAPEWKITDQQQRFVTRTLAAFGGLWGNHGYEAMYAPTYNDDRNEVFNGSRRYVFHLDKPLPVDAFWSVTMYDTPNYYLAANPINRYSIGDRTPGLVYNPDGSLDIYIQHDSPGADQESNWLPAPEGNFRPLIRMYSPREALLNGTVTLPPIRRIE